MSSPVGVWTDAGLRPSDSFAGLGVVLARVPTTSWQAWRPLVMLSIPTPNTQDIGIHELEALQLGIELALACSENRLDTLVRDLAHQQCLFPMYPVLLDKASTLST